MEMTQWESNQGITENNNNPEHLDEAQNIVPQQPQHLAPQGEVLVNIDEDEHNSWIVRGTRPGEETDRFAKFISTQEKELHSVYREFCRGGEGILRSAFAIFDITVSQGYTPESTIDSRLLLPLPARNDVKARSVKQRIWTLLSGWQKPNPPSEHLSNTLSQFVSWLEEPQRSGFQLILMASKTIGAADAFSYWRLFCIDRALPQSKRDLLPFRMLCQALMLSKFWQTKLTPQHPDDFKYLPYRLRVCLPSEVPKRSDENLRYSWPRSVPRASRIATYVWRSYKRPVDFEVVQLKVNRETAGLVKAILIFDTSSELNDFAQILKSTFEGNKDIIDVASIGEEQLSRLKYVLTRQTTLRIQAFLSNTLHTICDQDFKARDDPSRTRFLYLIQLNDYLLRMQEEINFCLADLEADRQQNSKAISQGMIQKLVDDSVYLQDKIKTALKEISELSDRLDKLSSFRQTQHSATLNLLLGTFVPLGFVTGFFGMNIQEINGSTYPLSTVLLIALPLSFAVMVIPLIFGTLVRILAHIGRGLKYGVTTSSPSLGQLLMIVPVMVAFLVHLNSAPQTDDYIGVDLFQDFLTYVRGMVMQKTNWEVPVVYSLVTIGAILRALAVLRQHPPSRLNLAFLFTLAVAALACATLNHLDGTGWVTFMIPMLILFVPIPVELVSKIFAFFSKRASAKQLRSPPETIPRTN